MIEKKKVIVVSQPMYFPWCGLFDQIRLSDYFVYYDDVQLSRGFYSRVQVKTPHGPKMISVPIQNRRQRQKINHSLISYETDWIAQHRATLISSYRKTRYLADAVAIFDQVTQRNHRLLSELGVDSMQTTAAYLGLEGRREFMMSSRMAEQGRGSQRLFDISRKTGAEIYLSGHGGLKYLDHSLFESGGIEVRYMNYQFSEYEQVLPPFNPYITILDAIAHLGPAAAEILSSTTLNWREAIGRSSGLRP